MFVPEFRERLAFLNRANIFASSVGVQPHHSETFVVVHGLQAGIVRAYSFAHIRFQLIHGDGNALREKSAAERRRESETHAADQDLDRPGCPLRVAQ